MSDTLKALPFCQSALKILIDGERNAVEQYSSYAEIAREEGLTGVACLFNALAAAEKVHIKNHLKALGEEYVPAEPEDFCVQSTVENLSAAITGEVEEAKKLYPRLLKSIRKEMSSQAGQVARLSMDWAMRVEKEHAKFLKQALKQLKNGSDFTFEVLKLCTVCGNLTLVDDESSCSVCGHDIIFFSTL